MERNREKLKLSNLGELKDLVKRVIDQPQPVVAGLFGPLGIGKTTFVRMCISELEGGEQKVISPTFVLHQSYETSKRVEHFDLFRLERVDENTLFEMGYFDALSRVRNERGLHFVEWPERVLDRGVLQLNQEFFWSWEGQDRVVEWNY